MAPPNFAMDTPLVNQIGGQIVSDCTADEGSAPVLGQAINNAIPRVASILNYPLTQFNTNFSQAYNTMLNQRLAIGKALQNSADAAELNEVKISGEFRGNGGLLPSPLPHTN